MFCAPGHHDPARVPPATFVGERLHKYQVVDYKDDAVDSPLLGLEKYLKDRYRGSTRPVSDVWGHRGASNG